MICSRKIRPVLLALLCTAVSVFTALSALPEPEPVPAMVDPLLTPPKSGDIAAFANDVILPRDGNWIPVNVKQEKIMEFFAKGEVKPDDRERRKWLLLTDFTLPDRILGLPVVQEEKKKSDKMENGRVYFNGLIRAEGVLVTKGNAVLFWKLWNDRVLHLIDESGRSCLLVLGEDASPSAPFLLPYDDFEGATAPAQKLYAKLPKFKPADVVAFSNRPAGSSVREMRNYVSRETINLCLPGSSNPSLARFDGAMDPFAPALADPQLKQMRQQYAAQGGVSPDEVTASGVLTTKDGLVVFWKLYADFALMLMDSRHRTDCVQVNMMYVQSGAACFTKFPMAGTSRLSCIARSLVAEGADWTPGGPPPLTPEKAIRGAWQELGRAAGGKDPAAWRVSMVATTAMNATRFKKWYYMVRFTSQAAAGGDAIVYVSMDGTAGEINEEQLGMKRMTEMRPERNQFQNQFRGFRGGFMD